MEIFVHPRRKNNWLYIDTYSDQIRLNDNSLELSWEILGPLGPVKFNGRKSWQLRLLGSSEKFKTISPSPCDIETKGLEGKPFSVEVARQIWGKIRASITPGLEQFKALAAPLSRAATDISELLSEAVPPALSAISSGAGDTSSLLSEDVPPALSSASTSMENVSQVAFEVSQVSSHVSKFASAGGWWREGISLGAGLLATGVYGGLYSLLFLK